MPADLYADLKRLGLCPRCKGSRGEPQAGKVMCAPCVADIVSQDTPRRKSERTKRMRRKRIAAGVCVTCEAELVTDRHCAKCRLEACARQKRIRDMKRGGPPVRKQKCSLCETQGHDIRTCPMRGQDRANPATYALLRPGAE